MRVCNQQQQQQAPHPPPPLPEISPSPACLELNSIFLTTFCILKNE